MARFVLEVILLIRATMAKKVEVDLLARVHHRQQLTTCVTWQDLLSPNDTEFLSTITVNQ